MVDTIKINPFHKTDIKTLKLNGTEIESIATELDQFLLSGIVADLGSGGIVWVVSPYAATIEKIYSVIDGAIATADAGLTFEIGGTAVTGGAIAITHGSSAAGDVDSSTPSALNIVAAGGAIEIIADNATTNAVACRVILVMQRT